MNELKYALNQISLKVDDTILSEKILDLIIESHI
jgi:hypothetical protein